MIKMLHLLVPVFLMLPLVSCEKQHQTGGDIPVTIERLTSSVLTDIKQKDLCWTFTHSVVSIENNGEPIPSDVVDSILHHADECRKIEATWSLSNDATKLTLSELKVDGEPMDGNVDLKISPAGAVRINVDSRQYNRAH